MRVMFLCLMLSACASTPSRYNQAAAPMARPIPWTQTYRSPAQPSYEPAGAGASHGGLAAPGSSEVERSKGGVLPRSDEPTIYPAMGAGPDGKVMRVALPAVEGGAAHSNVPGVCAGLLDWYLKRVQSSLVERVRWPEKGGSREQVECAALRLYGVCISDYLKDEKGQPGVDAGAMSRSVAKLVKERCKQGNTGAVEDLVDAVRRKMEDDRANGVPRPFKGPFGDDDAY